MEKTTSAGGVIVRFVNNQPEILLIRDLDYDDWFLPKGHVEEGESLEDTALREIEEETGLTGLLNKGYLGEFTRHAETANEMKTQKFFLFEKTDDTEPRVEEGKNWEIKWFNKESLPLFYLPEQEKIVRDNWNKIQSQ